MSAGTGLHWHLEAETLVPLAGFTLVYAAGVARLWKSAGRGRGLGIRQIGFFACGMVLLVAALCSPLAALSEQLFSAHMVVHEVLTAAAAPLLVLARPGGALAWALPSARGLMTRPLRVLAAPLTATLLQAAVIWLWHVPEAFRAASEAHRAGGRLPLCHIAPHWFSRCTPHVVTKGMVCGGRRNWLHATRGPATGWRHHVDAGGLIYAALALMLAGRWITRAARSAAT